jgi:hypothetical protein
MRDRVKHFSTLLAFASALSLLTLAAGCGSKPLNADFAHVWGGSLAESATLCSDGTAVSSTEIAVSWALEPVGEDGLTWQAACGATFSFTAGTSAFARQNGTITCPPTTTTSGAQLVASLSMGTLSLHNDTGVMAVQIYQRRTVTSGAKSATCDNSLSGNLQF